MRTPLASLVLGLALWSTSPASAQFEPCLEDPIQCAGETVDETIDEITGNVDDVTEPVDDVINPGGENPSPSIRGTRESDGSKGARDRDEVARFSSPGGVGSPEPISTARPGTGAGRVERPAAPRDATDPVGNALDRVRQSLSGSTETLAFPLGLTLVLGAFLLLQSRVDRSDPKLALAPVEPDDDILTFG
ncbi:MAG: hypothetical protein M3135_02220 [Actinomycetota bacterium]|nr:hypothetical protein [Actinomycetota bacterium]